MPSYDEPYRPQVHFTPERNWMNDPNGPIYLDGEYHLFYQYNPEGIDWGAISWAHAKSSDLLHWEKLPLALGPHPELGFPFSGSVVRDSENSSGLFWEAGGLVALFTNVDPRDFARQAQSVAFSRDRGITWELYEGNPVIPNTGRGNFRDPKVLWHRPTESWILVVAHEDEVLFYRSANLLDWEYASAFGAEAGSHAGIWECPDLFELPVEESRTGDASGRQQAGDPQRRWVLIVGDGDQAEKDAGGTQYFVGHFDGWRFENENPPEKTLWADSGRDFYAAQSWSGLPEEQGRRVWIAWMSQWIYGGKIPTDPWRGTMSLPRELGLRRTRAGVRLTQRPVRELQTLRSERIEPASGTGEYRFRGGGAVEICGLLTPDADPGPDAARSRRKIAGDAHPRAGVVRLTFEFDGGGVLELSVDFDEELLQMDRSRVDGAGFSPYFGGPSAIPLVELPRQPGSIRVILDRSTIEVFLEDGLVSATDLIFPPGFLRGLRVSTEGGAKAEELKVYALDSVWK